MKNYFIKYFSTVSSWKQLIFFYLKIYLNNCIYLKNGTKKLSCKRFAPNCAKMSSEFLNRSKICPRKISMNGNNLIRSPLLATSKKFDKTQHFSTFLNISQHFSTRAVVRSHRSQKYSKLNISQYFSKILGAPHMSWSEILKTQHFSTYLDASRKRTKNGVPLIAKYFLFFIF